MAKSVYVRFEGGRSGVYGEVVNVYPDGSVRHELLTLRREPIEGLAFLRAEMNVTIQVA